MAIATDGEKPYGNIETRGLSYSNDRGGQAPALR